MLNLFNVSTDLLQSENRSQEFWTISLFGQELSNTMNLPNTFWNTEQHEIVYMFFICSTIDLNKTQGVKASCISQLKMGSFMDT